MWIEHVFLFTHLSEMLSLTSRPHLDGGLVDLSERPGGFLQLMAVRWSGGCWDRSIVSSFIPVGERLKALCQESFNKGKSQALLTVRPKDEG